MGELSGRELDAAVATAMGCRSDTSAGYKRWQDRHGRPMHENDIPDYSTDHAALPDVLGWLLANVPTRSEAGKEVMLAGGSRTEPWLKFEVKDGLWYAGYVTRDDTHLDRWVFIIRHAPTLPEAVCRLVVAWAGRGT